MTLFAGKQHGNIDEKQLRKALEGFFAKNNCDEPEDCAAETVRRVLEAQSRQDIDHPPAFIWNTARLVLLEHARTKQRRRRTISIDEASLSTTDKTEQMILLREVLETLDPAEAALIRSSMFKERRDLAIELKLTLQQLNFRLFTIKNKLRTRLGKSAGKQS